MPLVFKDPAGAVIDVTGRTFAAKIADKGGTVLVTFTFDYSAAATGTVTALAALTIGPGVYDYDLWEMGATPTPLLTGSVTVSKRVTV